MEVRVSLSCLLSPTVDRWPQQTRDEARHKGRWVGGEGRRIEERLCEQCEDRRPDNSCLHHADAKSRDSDYNRDTVTSATTLLLLVSGQEMK